MYRAKEEGKVRYKLFDPGMEWQVTARMTLENDLRRAIERDEFEVYYQPVVALDTGRTVGMEALVRWEHPERGLVAPSEFVPLAEEIGLIVPIGRRVLREACQQAREWQGRYPSVSSDLPLIVGVNLSARQLRHPGLLEDVEGALRESGLDPRWLTLEITESAVVGDGESRVGILRKLREQGVRFALDDFGTGYSSLSYLKRLPAGLLKLDGSFVGEIGVSPGEDEVLLAGVIGIAHGLGLTVCAEGVETAEQAARLRELGCDLAQGHHFSGPLPGEAASRLLSNP
jgi:EAL domain-containing protein (putative c-di-GMP-specific phosphodiesterase class I)